MAQDAHAVGQTLAQLNVRARTGATVLAIHKPDAEVVLPSGHELLRAGDVLALAGDSDAIARATNLLTEGAAPREGGARAVAEAAGGGR